MTINDSFDIFPPKNFNFNECLVFLKRSDQELLHRIHKNSLYKAIQISGEIVLLKISIKNNRMHVSFPLKNTISSEIKLEVIEYFIQWFDLDIDIIPFYEMYEINTIILIFLF